MPRWSKITLKVLGVLLGSLILLWVGVAAYVQVNKKTLLEKITLQINESINGKIHIRDMEPALVEGFPGISVSLIDVSLRDSLWDQHRHELITAKNLFVAMNIFSIIRGNPTVRNLKFYDGNLYLFTDSNGYSNTNLLKGKNQAADDKGKSRKKINRIDFERVNFVVENLKKKKLYKFFINKLQSKIDYTSEGWDGNLKLDAVVHNLVFNTQKGSFLKNKQIVTNLDLTFVDDSGIVKFEPQAFRIGENEMQIGGEFGLAGKSSLFKLHFDVPKITLKKATSLLTPHISEKINRYFLEKPVSLKATISGDLKQKTDPHVFVIWQTTKNKASFHGMSLDDASFNGEYNNEAIPGKGRNDANSYIAFYNLTGKFATIPISADTVRLINLKNPLLSGRFKSKYPLTKLNSLYTGNTLVFSGGTAETDIIYRAPFDPQDNGPRYIKGTVRITNAAAKYIPRNVSFKNGDIKLNFKGRDLHIENMSLQSGSNKLKMTGYVKNLSNFYYSDPAKVNIDWNIYSPQINLKEFSGFLSSRQSVKKANNGKSAIDNFANLLDQASATVRMKLDKAIYNRFIANDVNAIVSLNQNGIVLNKVSLTNGGGSLNISGNVTQNGNINDVRFKTDLQNVNVRELFYSFNNFGQNGIDYSNLRGQLNAQTNISAKLKDDGSVVPASIKGTVAFDLRNGALVNFEPLQKIGDFAFKNRNFSNITFSRISNTLTLNGNYVSIPPMQIASNVLNIFMNGVYGFKSGTNLNLSVPLRNPEKDKDIENKSLKLERSTRGITINLHAVDGEDGKVKFKLGKGD